MFNIRKPDWGKVRQIVIVVFLLLAAVRGLLGRRAGPDVRDVLYIATEVESPHTYEYPDSGTIIASPAPEENSEALSAGEGGEPSRGGSGESTEASRPGTADSADGRVSINHASQGTLETLSVIGPTKAKAIIAYRQEYGGFRALEELMEVKGIGQATYAKIKDSIRL